MTSGPYTNLVLSAFALAAGATGAVWLLIWLVIEHPIVTIGICIVWAMLIFYEDYIDKNRDGPPPPPTPPAVV